MNDTATSDLLDWNSVNNQINIIIEIRQYIWYKLVR